jgi:hypothetical protein
LVRGSSGPRENNEDTTKRVHKLAKIFGVDDGFADNTDTTHEGSGTHTTGTTEMDELCRLLKTVNNRESSEQFLSRVLFPYFVNYY